jgi:hypothetical protein
MNWNNLNKAIQIACLFNKMLKNKKNIFVGRDGSYLLHKI